MSSFAASLPDPLTRYRVMAYVTGVLLVLLVCVAVPLKYAGGHPEMARVLGIAHGWLYMIYVVTALDLGVRRRWSLVRIVLVALAGTVPFASFIAERRIMAQEHARDAALATH